MDAKLHAADTAIDGLDLGSSDAEVATAQAALSAASAALRKVKLLSGPQVNAYHAQIDAATVALASKREQISDNRTHGQQLAVLDKALSNAGAAVLALNRMSTDAELSAARAAVEAASAALAAGTKLTAEEKTAAGETIAEASAALEYVTVDAGVYTAQTAVDGADGGVDGRGRGGRAGCDRSRERGAAREGERSDVETGDRVPERHRRRAVVACGQEGADCRQQGARAAACGAQRRGLGGADVGGRTGQRAVGYGHCGGAGCDRGRRGRARGGNEADGGGEVGGERGDRGVPDDARERDGSSQGHRRAEPPSPG